MKHTEETKRKIAESCRKAYKEGRGLTKEQYKKLGEKTHQRNLKNLVTIRTTNKQKVVLDITRGELEEYRKSHPVCEICGIKSKVITFTGNTGRTEPNKLSIDHDHKTGHFRGLLCAGCNRRLGWYEQVKDSIKEYLGE